MTEDLPTWAEQFEIGDWVEFYPAPKLMIIGIIRDKQPEGYTGKYFVQTKYGLIDGKLDRSFTDGIMIEPNKLRRA